MKKKVADKRDEGVDERKEIRIPCNSSSRKNLYNTITSATDDPSSVLTPDDSAYTFSTHQSMASDLLGAASFL